MAEKRVCGGCGEAYWWPGAKWHHEKCVAKAKPVAVPTVVSERVEREGLKNVEVVDGVLKKRSAVKPINTAREREAAINRPINAVAINSASDSAGFPKEPSNGDREGGSEKHEVEVEPVSRPSQAMEEVGRTGSAGVQRGLQRDGRKSVDLPPPEAGKDVQKPLEDDGVERRVDSGGRGDVSSNGRRREDYNAYMRAYMRQRRAAGRVSG